MDRRSWLWRRKSSDKSSGETESLGSGSGSIISSPSERFSDEQQGYSIQNAQSPEVTSKAVSHVEDTNDSVEILSEKLSAAVASIREKEELVKQHSKVADEAVSGWERAEQEVNVLRQQLDAATKKNVSLEDRIVHLDEALKECLRQLRQVREEQDQRVQEASDNKSEDTEPKSSEFHEQLADLRAQLDTANTRAEAAASLESDLRLKLASTEKENISLQLELRSRFEELELRTLERDLSTERAETASKLHLESIKKVAKLGAECRRLKAMSHKEASFNHNRLFSVSPSYVGSPTDSQSNSIDGAPLKSHVSPAPSIGILDDFLQMEKLAALPGRESRSSTSGSASSIDKHNENGKHTTSLKAELEAMINRTAELEERIEMVEAEKVELGLTLNDCQEKVKLSESSLECLQAQFTECQNQLKLSQAQLRDANKKLGMLQAELDLASELRQAIDLELDDANTRREEAEAQCNTIENESKILLAKVSFLEGQAEKERTMYAEASAKCLSLEDELFRMKEEVDTWQSQLALMNDSKDAVELELRDVDGQKTATESELQAVQAEVKSLLTKNVSLECQAKTERLLSAELDVKCRKLETELSAMKHNSEIWQSQLTSANDLKKTVTRELQMANAKKEEVESKLKVTQEEAKSLLVRVSSLELVIEKERTLSAEFSVKCRKLEDELSKMKPEADFHFALPSKEEVKKQQEEELAVAASKFAECQKTIASLGNQLKSLATLEDIFLDSEKHLSVSDKDTLLLRTDSCAASLPSSSTEAEHSDSLPSESLTSFKVSVENDHELSKDAKDQSSSSVLHKNGFGKLFSRARSTLRSQS